MSDHLDPAPDRLTEGGLAARETSVEDTQGAPTWPIGQGATAQVIPPPVGLNWGTVARQLGTSLRVLLHDGSIVVIGEYFPEAGYFLEPTTLRARFVDVGQQALQRGYFLGKLSVSEFHIPIEPDPLEPTAEHPVIRTDSGPIIGLFTSDDDAARARHSILRGSLGSGVRVEKGPLGTELHVQRAELAGRVATVIAGEGGAVISVSGTPIRTTEGEIAPLATGMVVTGESGDARRPGTGAHSNSPGY